MTYPQSDDIPQFDAHDDAETLRNFDHPTESIRRWVGVLTAKAWIGPDLACFFIDAEQRTMRTVLIFKAFQDFKPRFDGIDMRQAIVGCCYELDVFVAPPHPPIIDSVEPV